LTTHRLYAADKLRLNFFREMDADTVSTHDINSHTWSVISVSRPFSTDFHVMLMETSMNRYLPSLEWIGDEDGSKIMGLWRGIISFLKNRSNAERVFIGYNWSPRSWGQEEEKEGFQSIPTKWHPMIWSWPKFPPPGECSDSISWVAEEALTHVMRRNFGINEYGEIFAHIIKSRILPVIGHNPVPGFSKIEANATGVTITYELDLENMLSSKGFFPRLLKPIAVALNDLMVEITQSFTDMDCAKIDYHIEKAIVTRPTIEDMQLLRSAPKLKQKDQIFSNLQNFNLPIELFSAVYRPIELRCWQQGPSSDHWRKGFGYALVVSSDCSEGNICRIKIMPGVYIGPGGVVEAQGIVLRRPGIKKLPMETVVHKRRTMHALKDHLNRLNQRGY
jgi:hypothetical protein